MFNNVGMLDRLIRFSLTGVLLYLGFGVYGGSALGIRIRNYFNYSCPDSFNWNLSTL
jgi:hypothetical protein